MADIQPGATISVPSSPPSPAPAGWHWTSHLAGNGFGGSVLVWTLVKDVDTGSTPSQSNSQAATAPAPAPPHLQFSFDTIGQIIPRTIGNNRLPLKLLWVLGIDLPYDSLTTVTDAPNGTSVLSFAAIPPWIGTGLSIDGPVGIPLGTVISAVSGSTITMSAAAIDDIPANSVVTITSPPDAHKDSPDTFVTSAGASAGATSLHFASLPSWLAVGAVVQGSTAIPGGAVISSLPGGGVIVISQALLEAIPAGTAIEIGGGPSTVTFAAALCAPIDPLEQGLIISLYDGSSLIFSSTQGVVLPPTWTTQEQALLVVSLAGVIYYPGTESQLPAPLIQNDRGVTVTNAFRGLRYIIVPNYPTTKGMPSLTAEFHRTNPTTPPSNVGNNIIAVQFAAGSG